MSRIPAILLLWISASGVVFATPPDFDREVAPILTQCMKCHSEKTAKGELDLSRKKAAFEGGTNGPAIVAGKPESSPLWQRVNADEMPPRKPLSAREKNVLKAWIVGGANWGRDQIGELEVQQETWWSFAPLPPKQTAAKTLSNPIDPFIDLKLQASGLQRSPEADRRTLLRRLKFDLLGLPPTIDEVESFLNDRSPNAYETRVEQYLASPHFGERWARHWLDAVRFAESNGFETNQPRSNAWPYRDWVIASFNSDLPYDRFVFDQLAGDSSGTDAATGFLVAGPWDQVKSPDPVLTAQQRADELHDMVSTTGSAFLGLTVGCARCHTHKFDPISHGDYHRVKAVFSGVQHGERDYRTPESIARAKRIEELNSRIASLERQMEGLDPLADPGATAARRRPVQPRRNLERIEPTKAKYLRFVILATNGAEPCIDELEVYATGSDSKNVALASNGTKARSAGDYPSSDRHRLQFVNDGQYGNGRSWISNKTGRGRVELEFQEVVEIDRIVWGRDRDGQFADRLPIRYRIDLSLDGRSWIVAASSDDRLDVSKDAPTMPPDLSPGERLAWKLAAAQISGWKSRVAELSRSNRVYAGQFTTPEPTYRLHRGDVMSRREPIGPGVLESIGPKVSIPEGATDRERRTALANWIIDPKNPLTARVIANRLWQGHFGTGLVETPSDFGRNGAKPSHPELLDWLARELIDHRWSLKHIHRLIVTSRTYRQSSRMTDAGLSRDAGSRLLWRYPAHRLEAEAIRDALLVTSGKLDATMGGPGFDLFEENTNYVKVYTARTSFGPAQFRRMVYWSKPRMQLDGTFGVFDCPDGGQIAPKRNVSTTPLQSLNLLNGSFLNQQAGFLADRVKTDADPVRQIFRLAFQREPSAIENEAATKLVREHGLTALARAILNANEFLQVD